nr:HAD family phosphatase [Ornithinimicrobium cryptoxanthini]
MTIDGHPFDAVVFDFDGVLADTAKGWAAAEAAVCAHYGVDYTDELAVGTHGVGLDDSVRHLTAGVQPAVTHHEAAALMRAMADEHVPPHLEPIDGVAVTVETLAGWVPVAIASNTEQKLLERLVAELGLDQWVTAVVAASEVPAPKPAPDIYLEAARRLGARPGRTLAVEDSPTGGRAADAAGCLVLALQLPGAPPVPDLCWAAMTAESHADLLAMLSPTPDSSPSGAPAPLTITITTPDAKDAHP